MQYPTPHLDKLKALAENIKLPDEDKPRVTEAVTRYEEWIESLEAVEGDNYEDIARNLVALLNEYKLFIDVDLIFGSDKDFLYRQKGQTKIDNTVIEEFLPRLVGRCLFEGNAETGITLGPTSAFSAVYFTSTLNAPAVGGGVHVRRKDQDFAIAKRVYLRTSHSADFAEAATESFYIAHVAAECKTNLDKTMFQEAVATAHHVKTAVVGSKYYLLCEWLDMTPQSTAPTDIDEVIILRKAKRMSSNVRSAYGTAAGRHENRDNYEKFLKDHPYEPEMFIRFLNHIDGLIGTEDPVEDDVLDSGFF